MGYALAEQSMVFQSEVCASHFNGPDYDSLGRERLSSKVCSKLFAKFNISQTAIWQVMNFYS